MDRSFYCETWALTRRLLSFCSAGFEHRRLPRHDPARQHEVQVRVRHGDPDAVSRSREAGAQQVDDDGRCDGSWSWSCVLSGTHVERRRLDWVNEQASSALLTLETSCRPTAQTSPQLRRDSLLGINAQVSAQDL